MSTFLNESFRLEIERFVESKKDLNQDQIDLLNELIDFNLESMKGKDIKLSLIGLDKSVDDLDVSPKLNVFLKSYNLYTIKDLLLEREKDLQKVKGITPRMFKELKATMEKLNLEFAS